MKRTKIAACVAAVSLALPQAAVAQEQAGFLSVPPVSLIASLIGLGVALVLLLEAVAVGKVARGGAIAEKISYVVLGVVCLGASAVAQWARNFVVGITLDQVQFASQVLVVAAMGLFAAYFGGVRRALQGYMAGATPVAEPTEAAVEQGGSGEAPRG